jgi:hypothetical protein
MLLLGCAGHRKFSQGMLNCEVNIVQTTMHNCLAGNPLGIGSLSRVPRQRRLPVLLMQSLGDRPAREPQPMGQGPNRDAPNAVSAEKNWSESCRIVKTPFVF